MYKRKKNKIKNKNQKGGVVVCILAAQRAANSRRWVPSPGQYARQRVLSRCLACVPAEPPDVHPEVTQHVTQPDVRFEFLIRPRRLVSVTSAHRIYGSRRTAKILPPPAAKPIMLSQGVIDVNTMLDIPWGLQICGTAYPIKGTY